MNKLRLETNDTSDENVKKIAALFPNCVTEADDGKGGLKQSVNFALLRQMLSPDVVDGAEHYEFTWVGKKASIVEANKPIRKTLRPCKEESKNWDATENLYIEGDNLEVLKLLQESYLGKVKMIYIDPPYNTGNDFIYADDFMRSQEEENQQMGMYDENGDRLFKNTDTNGRFHSDWCSMMYSRLMLARNLLADDGVIFISIDDNEVTNARKLCDEIFGEANFRNEIIVRRGAKSVQAQFETWDKLGRDFEYVLLYTKCSDYRFPQQKRMLEETKSGSWNNHWRGTDRPTMRYEIFGITPSSGQWRWSKDRSDKAIENYARLTSEIGEKPTDEQIDKWYQKKGGDMDLLRLSSKGKPEHYIAPTCSTLLNSSWMDLMVTSSSELMSLFGGKVFDMPKSPEVVKRMLGFSTKDALILDFFSGSGSTAHAIIEANAEDGGRRKFIMVQLPEPCDVKSEAFKAGYKNICEIGKERIRRAGEKILKECGVRSLECGVRSGEKCGVRSVEGGVDNSKLNTSNSTLDVGFRVLKVADSNMKDVYYAVGDYSQDLIAKMESNIKEGRTDLDLLFGCLLDWGLPLSCPCSSEKMDGCTVHTYNGGDLIACFDVHVPESVVKAIAKRKPLRAVFRDAGFASSPEKINVFEVFKHYAPETRVKVI